MEFKDSMKILMSDSNISVAELAKKLGKTESAIRMWGLGKSKPDADTIIKLTKIFNCSADYLLGLSDVKHFDVDKKAMCDKTGLSERAVDALAAIKRDEIMPYFDKLPQIINFLFENEGGLKIFKHMQTYIFDDFEFNYDSVLEIKSGNKFVTYMEQRQFQEMFLLNISAGLSRLRENKNRK